MPVMTLLHNREVRASDAAVGQLPRPLTLDPGPLTREAVALPACHPRTPLH